MDEEQMHRDAMDAYGERRRSERFWKITALVVAVLAFAGMLYVAI